MPPKSTRHRPSTATKCCPYCDQFFLARGYASHERACQRAHQEQQEWADRAVDTGDGTDPAQGWDGTLQTQIIGNHADSYAIGTQIPGPADDGIEIAAIIEDVPGDERSGESAGVFDGGKRGLENC